MELSLEAQMKWIFYCWIWKSSKKQQDCRLPFLNPILHGVFWITHIWGGQILPAPYNTVISKDTDLKFGMLELLVIVFSKLWRNVCKSAKWRHNDVVRSNFGPPGIKWNLYFWKAHDKSYPKIQISSILDKYFKSYGNINAIWALFGMGFYQIWP